MAVIIYPKDTGCDFITTDEIKTHKDRGVTLRPTAPDPKPMADPTSEGSGTWATMGPGSSTAAARAGLIPPPLPPFLCDNVLYII
jgi:hypothetical protein